MSRVMRQAVIDPFYAIVLSGFAAEQGCVVDEFWMRGGMPHAAISVEQRDAFTPPDITVIRYNTETTAIEEVAWHNGAMSQFDPTFMDPECSICRQRHVSDDRHFCE